MANVYVDSAAAGAGTGADWANAYTTLAAACAAKAAGDDFWVASGHAESTAGVVTVACPGTLASPCRIISVNKAGSVPPVAADILAGASIATTGANALTINGHFYAYGLTYSAGSGAVSAPLILGGSAGNKQTHDTPTLISLSSSTSNMNTGQVAGGVEITLLNPKFKFGAIGSSLVCSSVLNIRGGSVLAGGANVTAFLDPTAAARYPMPTDISGFDFSGWAAGLFLVKGGASLQNGSVKFRNCKLPGSWSGALFSAALTAAGLRGEMYNCAADTANYKLWIEDIIGSIRDETTIVRTGGASDGTTPFSWKMVTNADSDNISNILRSPEIFLFNGTTGSKTLTAEIIHSGVGSGAAGAFTNQEIWLEVQYLGSAATPVSSFATNRAATVLTAAADQAASTATWTSSPATPVKQKLSVTFTANLAGMYIATICLAPASKTVYVDPVITVS